MVGEIEILYGVIGITIVAFIVVFWYTSEFFAHFGENIRKMKKWWNEWADKFRKNYEEDMVRTQAILRRKKNG